MALTAESAGTKPRTESPTGIIGRPRVNRLEREARTLGALVRLYCRSHHGRASLCPDCQALLDYACTRLERCRFGAEKPTCARCPVHCYQALQRERVKAVMRYAGPRLLWRHPWLSLRHWLDGLSPLARV
jgi:hypothetical protein